MIGRLRSRLERLERWQPTGGIRWDNLHAASPEDIVPDGVIDWTALLRGPSTREAIDPVEEAIRAVLALPDGEPNDELGQPVIRFGKPSSNGDGRGRQPLAAGDAGLDRGGLVAEPQEQDNGHYHGN